MRTIICWTTLVVLFLTGCVHQTKSPSVGSQVTASRLTEAESDRLKRVAWDAAHSPDIVEQFGLKRSTESPMKLKKEGIACYVDRETEDKVEVCVPDAGHHDIIHGHYVAVTVDRRTFEVLGMKEGFWP